MPIQREILFYTCGDSYQLSTWSNVPYLFAKALERKGFTLHRIDISPNERLNHLFNSLCFLIFKRILHLRSCPVFHRTWLHRFITYRHLKKAAKDYPNSEMNLFLSFAFTNIYSPKPNILWCDWTDRIVIQRLGRSPQWFEKRSLAHEDIVMKKADLVYTMFPKCQRQMEKMYGREIEYLHRNVINTVYDDTYDHEKNIKVRLSSNKLLFIGNHRYISGAFRLIKAFQCIRKSYPQLELHLIGLGTADIPTMDNVYCHGYLHKDHPQEKELYYDLLLGCRCVINPTIGWAGYSSCVEAMYYGCPVIISPYDDFTEEFGNDIDFGYFCNDDDLEEKLSLILDTTKYT